MTSLRPSRSRRGLSRPRPIAPTTDTEKRQPEPKPTAAETDRTEPMLYTAEQAAALLQVRPSWLRRKAAARAVPCRYLGKHLCFSHADITAISEASATAPHQPRRRL